MLRRLHRWLGVALAVPFLVWMATGLLFHVKHRYGEAYEQLVIPYSGPIRWTEFSLSPSDLVKAGRIDAGASLKLVRHPSGRAVYHGQLEGTPVALDAATGEALAPTDEEQARRWIEAAVSASPSATRYGQLKSLESARHDSALTGSENAAFVAIFSGGKRVTLDRITGEISQTGALNEWIDGTYRAHYLQWTPWQPVNIALVLIAVPAVVILAGSGLFMALRRQGAGNPGRAGAVGQSHGHDPA